MAGILAVPTDFLTHGAGKDLAPAHKGILLELYLRAARRPQAVRFDDGGILEIQTGEVFIGQRSLAEQLGVSRWDVRSALDALTQCGAIEWVQRARDFTQSTRPLSRPLSSPLSTLLRLREYLYIPDTDDEHRPIPRPDSRPTQLLDTFSPTERRPDESPEGVTGQSVLTLVPDEPAPKRRGRPPGRRNGAAGSGQPPGGDRGRREAPGPSNAEPGTVGWVLSTFCEAWEQRRGGSYPPVWARDGAHAKRLLGFPGATPDEVRARVGRFFDRMATDTWLAQNASFPLFVNRWASLDGKSVVPQPGRAARREFIGTDPDGRPIYREA